MSGVQEFSYLHKEAADWRRYLHQNPELGYDLPETAAFVAKMLASFGIEEIETGIAETGVIAVVRGTAGDGPTVGLRADMDALPIEEMSNKPWSSKKPGLMHACGHDGHTAMLLGAATHIARYRNFRGAVAFIFQPAEEEGRGAERMVQQGIMERYDITGVYGMHTSPGLDIGRFAIREGTIMAALDEFDIVVIGKGGHAAQPDATIDPVVVASQIIVTLQTLVSRNTKPTESLVVSVPKVRSTGTYNVIPNQVELGGTVRSISPALRDFAERQVEQCARGVASAMGAAIEFTYRRLEPLTYNHPEQTRSAVAAARRLVGGESVDANVAPVMGAEDFAYMLQVRPGSYIFIGNGPTAGLHHPSFDFDDEALPYGIGYWVNLVNTLLAG
ncbi:hippurate hydrolase [Mesorhizobium albiziae]|uniref:Hippurate hydrolase n=1 Tax=Neomesorhizobium albiziae TaxID=335020 RepID=A0A1I4FTK5_9HYPH|nr:M20 aminoacylase family protein [Mesorhizobium albiziae]GLS32574.1 hippurate hydrolase [Mesorhizobium albiziae]SFL21145.1 hippurate hydrolase [Mesorhizobium albiziae]